MYLYNAPAASSHSRHFSWSCSVRNFVTVTDFIALSISSWRALDPSNGVVSLSRVLDMVVGCGMWDVGWWMRLESCGVKDSLVWSFEPDRCVYFLRRSKRERVKARGRLIFDTSTLFNLIDTSFITSTTLSKLLTMHALLDIHELWEDIPLYGKAFLGLFILIQLGSFVTWLLYLKKEVANAKEKNE